MKPFNRKFVVTLVGGAKFTVVNVSSFQVLGPGCVTFTDEKGQKSDYFNSVIAVQEQA